MQEARTTQHFRVCVHSRVAPFEGGDGRLPVCSFATGPNRQAAAQSAPFAEPQIASRSPPDRIGNLLARKEL